MFEIGDIFKGIDYSNQEKFIGLVLVVIKRKKIGIIIDDIMIFLI